MKSFLYFVIKGICVQAFLCLALDVSAQPSFSKGLLWEIRPPKSAISSYLYGTIHVQDQRVFEYGDSVTICFNQASSFASEVIINRSASKAMAKKILLPSNTSLKQLIGKVYFKNLKKYLKENNLGAYNLMINRLKPFWVAGLLSQAKVPKERAEILDLYFQRLATQQNKSLQSLELIDQQLEVIDDMNLEIQTDLLKKTIDDLSIKKTNNSESLDYETLLNAYLSQDLTQIQVIVNSDTSDFAVKMMDNLILKRNYRMINKINELCLNASSFIAVGAAHLSGEQGLLNLLFLKGYQIRPVFTTFKKQ